MTGSVLIAKARENQLIENKYTIESDFKKYQRPETLVEAAMCLLMRDADWGWPFKYETLQRLCDEPFDTRIAHAGALLAAAIDLNIYDNERRGQASMPPEEEDDETFPAF